MFGYGRLVIAGAQCCLAAHGNPAGQLFDFHVINAGQGVGPGSSSHNSFIRALDRFAVKGTIQLKV